MANAGVDMSVWTAIDIGTAPQLTCPKASLKAILYEKSRPSPPYSSGLVTPRVGQRMSWSSFF